jgi:hypothetical protein
MTAGQQSTIKLWDLKKNKIEKYIHAFDGKVTDTENSEFSSKFISTINLDSSKNYMVCGGGSTYSTIWNLSSLTISSVLPTSSFTNDSMFTEDKLITVGNEKYIYIWEKNGVLSHRLDSGLKEIFSISSNQKNVRISNSLN